MVSKTYARTHTIAKAKKNFVGQHLLHSFCTDLGCRDVSLKFLSFLSPAGFAHQFSLPFICSPRAHSVLPMAQLWMRWGPVGAAGFSFGLTWDHSWGLLTEPVLLPKPCHLCPIQPTSKIACVLFPYCSLERYW